MTTGGDRGHRARSGEITRLHAEDVVAHDDEAQKEEDEDDDERGQVLDGLHEGLLQQHQVLLEGKILERLDDEHKHSARVEDEDVVVLAGEVRHLLVSCVEEGVEAGALLGEEEGDAEVVSEACSRGGAKALGWLAAERGRT